jgi:hypothetical protein
MHLIREVHGNDSSFIYANILARRQVILGRPFKEQSRNSSPSGKSLAKKAKAGS